MFGWNPKIGVFYRSWSGDGRHNVTVEAVIDNVRYPAAFKIYHAILTSTEKAYEGCDVWVLPHKFSQNGRKGRIPSNILKRSFRFTIPQKLVEFNKKESKETLPPVQGYRTTYVNFKTINYEVKIKELPSDVRMRFISWKNSL